MLGRGDRVEVSDVDRPVEEENGDRDVIGGTPSRTIRDSQCHKVGRTCGEGNEGKISQKWNN